MTSQTTWWPGYENENQYKRCWEEMYVLLARWWASLFRAKLTNSKCYENLFKLWKLTTRGMHDDIYFPSYFKNIGYSRDVL